MNGNLEQSAYDREGHMMEMALVRSMRATTIWADMCEIAHALIHVQRQRKAHLQEEGTCAVAALGQRGGGPPRTALKEGGIATGFNTQAGAEVASQGLDI